MPGYLALVFDQWEIMLTVLIISVVTYLIVTHGLSRWGDFIWKKKIRSHDGDRDLLEAPVGLSLPRHAI